MRLQQHAGVGQALGQGEQPLGAVELRVDARRDPPPAPERGDMVERGLDPLAQLDRLAVDRLDALRARPLGQDQGGA